MQQEADVDRAGLWYNLQLSSVNEIWTYPQCMFMFSCTSQEIYYFVLAEKKIMFDAYFFISVSMWI